MKKIVKKKRFYISFAALLLLIYAYDFLEMRISTPAYKKILAENPLGLEAKFGKLKKADRELRYLEIGQDSLPLVVFIHGAPSSSSFWRTFLKDTSLLSKAKLMAVDRPGYGYSGYGKPETSVKKQAALIAEVIRSKREQHPSVILHGSSYGGTIAARIAMDFPDLIDGLLLQSASLMPGKEKTYTFTHITKHWPFRWLLPGSIHVANMEKLSHKIQLDSMAGLWGRIRSASIILHGDSDNLIYPENAIFAKERLVNASFLESKIIDGRKHDLLWTKRQLLKQSLEKLIQVTIGQYDGLENFSAVDN
ncbi:MAG: alpha/beta hydrolase [Mameliella sp.]|nr:alpha/beta hydrolase [Phaeodactylibacter sp.]